MFAIRPVLNLFTYGQAKAASLRFSVLMGVTVYRLQ